MQGTVYGPILLLCRGVVATKLSTMAIPETTGEKEHFYWLIFKDISAWSLDMVTLYSITLLIVDTAAAPALYVVSQFYPWSLCSSLKDVDSHCRFSHLFYLIGKIYKSRNGNIPHALI